MGRKMKYDFLDAVRKMPPLAHSRKEGKFDISESEAAAWIANQPEVMQKIFDTARYHGAIKYNPATGKWQGADYHGN